MDINKTTEGPNGIDLTLLPITQLVPLAENSGFLMVKRLDDYPVLYCTHDDCFELAEFAVFCVSSDGEHAYAYNCDEHTQGLVDLGNQGVKAYRKQ